MDRTRTRRPTIATLTRSTLAPPSKTAINGIRQRSIVLGQSCSSACRLSYSGFSTINAVCCPVSTGRMDLAVRQIVDRSIKPLIRLLPRNAAVDRAYHALLFCWKHGRLPRRGAKMWNDMWYHVKTSGEILEPLRVFVTDKEIVKSYVS